MKISEMKNLGPAVEADLNAMSITSSEQVIKLGPEKTFIKMLEGRMLRDRSASCCNALYLYAIYGAIHDIDWRKIPESKKTKFKQLSEKLRKSGKFK